MALGGRWRTAAAAPDAGIATKLFLSEAAVGKHSTSIFRKLDLPQAPDDHRRVLAVLAWLDAR